MLHFPNRKRKRDCYVKFFDLVIRCSSECLSLAVEDLFESEGKSLLGDIVDFVWEAVLVLGEATFERVFQQVDVGTVLKWWLTLSRLRCWDFLCWISISIPKSSCIKELT
jgi:hypothetical protein